MGRPKIKIMDDAQEAPEKASKKTLDVRSEKLENKQGLRSDDLQTSNIKPQDPASNVQHPTSKTTKPGKAKPRGKKYQEIVKDLDRTKVYPLSEAVDTAKKMSYSKFNATLEAHINTVQTGIRGLIKLPYASGRTLRILLFPSTSLKANPKDAAELQEKGCIFGSDSTLDDISKGKIDFDLVITTPEWMPKLAKVAKILGPKGLMPNPKNGTIIDLSADPAKGGADGLKKAVEGFQAGKTEYKTEPKAPVIHLALGKLNQPNEELVANVKTLLQTVGKSRIKKVTLSPTMGPGIKLDLSSI